jgi:ATP-dependent Clp protease ATP-binding subunit ClpB
LIGPPGVGKTAILEGLASRIVSKEVPEVGGSSNFTIDNNELHPKSIQHKRVLSIDLASIMAGTGIRGQFEEKFKALIKDIEDEVGEFSLIHAPTCSLISLSRPGWEYNMLHR